MLFKNNTIEKKVMEVMKDRIDTAQEKFNEGCKALDEKFEQDIEALKLKREEEKELNAENLAKSVLGNLS